MDYKQLWSKTLEKYSIIKELYIECEETDPELNTNLQPLNEFRAALDHIMKAAAVICDESYNEQEKENFAWEQFDKLNSHLDRTFYDICDFLSINYRNKITDILEMGDSDVISKVYPDYYSKWKNQIEDISNRIIKYRFYKGMKQNNVQQSFEEYKKDVEVLRDIYIGIRKGITSFEEIIAEKIYLKKKIIENNTNKKNVYEKGFTSINNITFSAMERGASLFEKAIFAMDRGYGNNKMFLGLDKLEQDYVIHLTAKRKLYFHGKRILA